jgi:hypothetical protein
VCPLPTAVSIHRIGDGVVGTSGSMVAGGGDDSWRRYNALSTEAHMRVSLPGNCCWLILLLAASVSCGSAAQPASPTQARTPISISTRCFGPFHPGDIASAACFVDVQGGASPSVRAFADLRMFRGRAESELVECPACGPPPWQFDVDVRIPPDMSPGPKTFHVWATDAQGRRADTTATFEVTAR